MPSSRGALILLSRRIKQKQKSPGANHKRLMVSKSVSHFSKGTTCKYHFPSSRQEEQFYSGSFSIIFYIILSSSMHFDFHFFFFFFFFFFFLNQAKFTLTFNHHGLTLHPTTVDVSKLKTFQLQQKILKP